MEEWRRAAALAVVDLDRFKQFNDVHGHAVGDEVLKRVTTSIGLAVSRAAGGTETCLFRADRAFYAAEEGSRDRVRMTA